MDSEKHIYDTDYVKIGDANDDSDWSFDDHRTIKKAVTMQIYISSL